MNETKSPKVTRDYLRELERALAGLAPGIRGEIVAGAREELDGLDADAARLRIQELGDPKFIAAEAGAAATPPPAAAREPGWYPVVAALLVMVGGIIVPFIGFLAGMVMVWFSKTWTRAEKWVATLTPVAAVLALAGVMVATRAMNAGGEPQDPGDFHPPRIEDFQNPLIPSAFDLFWSSALLTLGVAFVVGAWLLWRARARS